MSWLLAIVVTMIGESSLLAQIQREVLVDEVWITFPPVCTSEVSKKWPELLVVLDGDEEHAFPAKYRDQDHAWVGQKEGRFFASGRKASLRLDGRRTECRKSGDPVKDKTLPNTWAASFGYFCNTEEVKRITATVHPLKLPVSYVRRLPKTFEDSVPCIESSRLVGPILDVWQKSEEVRLQLGARTPDANKLGMRVDEGLMKKCVKEKKSLHLDHDAMQCVLEALRARGDGAAPTFSGVAIDIDEKNLAAYGFESLDLRVTP